MVGAELRSLTRLITGLTSTFVASKGDRLSLVSRIFCAQTEVEHGGIVIVNRDNSISIDARNELNAIP